MKKKTIVWVIAIALIATACVGVTIAYLVASSPTVVNTFTVGDVNITLTETTGDDYPILPGATLDKDPNVTVKADSDACWLFVRITEGPTFDDYMAYAIADGWTPLSSGSDVYYRRVAAVEVDTSYPILKNNQVTVHREITEEDLAAITQNPTLTFYAYAIQSDQMETVQEAWQTLNEQEGLPYAS